MRNNDWKGYQVGFSPTRRQRKKIFLISLVPIVIVLAIRDYLHIDQILQVEQSYMYFLIIIGITYLTSVGIAYLIVYCKNKTHWRRVRPWFQKGGVRKVHRNRKKKIVIVIVVTLLVLGALSYIMSHTDELKSYLEKGSVKLSDKINKDVKSVTKPYVPDITQIESLVYQKTNEQRQALGLPPLTLNIIASQEARKHSQDMAKWNDGIDHTGFESRASVACGNTEAGENVAQTYVGLSNDITASEPVDVWMKSSGHRANIVHPFHSIGVGIAITGGYVYTTQLFCG